MSSKNRLDQIAVYMPYCFRESASHVDQSGSVMSRFLRKDSTFGRHNLSSIYARRA